MGDSTCKKELNETIAEIFFKGVVFVIGFLANILVFLTLSRSRKLRSNNTFFLCSLSLAGLLFAILSSPLSSVVTLKWYHRTCAWKIMAANRIVYYMAFLASIYTLTLMSIERSYVICNPLKYKRYITETKVQTAIGGVWVVSTTLGVAEGLGAFTDKVHSLLNITSIACCYTVMTSCYICIFKVIRKQRQIYQGEVTKTRSQIRCKVERKLAKTIGLIVGVFLITWSPLTYTFAVFPQIGTAGDAFAHWSVTFGMASALFNPLIYFFRSREFRKASGQILCKWFCNQKRESLKSIEASTIARKTPQKNHTRDCNALERNISP